MIKIFFLFKAESYSLIRVTPHFVHPSNDGHTGGFPLWLLCITLLWTRACNLRLGPWLQLLRVYTQKWNLDHMLILYLILYLIFWRNCQTTVFQKDIVVVPGRQTYESGHDWSRGPLSLPHTDCNTRSYKPTTDLEPGYYPAALCTHSRKGKLAWRKPLEPRRRCPFKGRREKRKEKRREKLRV